jgi:hypothetical protein
MLASLAFGSQGALAAFIFPAIYFALRHFMQASGIYLGPPFMSRRKRCNPTSYPRPFCCSW